MTPELAAAIARTRKFFETRSHSNDWGRNIVEGSFGITSQEDWTAYYSYLTNPDGFDPEAKLETLDPHENIKPLPEGLCFIKHKNGNDYEINIKNTMGEDDEKVEST